jgi:hypothetical protein
MNPAITPPASDIIALGPLAEPESLRVIALSEEDLSDSLKRTLRANGYGHTPAEVWGKVVGEGTAFLDIGADATLAWVYMPELEGFLGSRLRVAGPPEAAVPEAMHQLNVLLQSHAQSGSEVISDVSTWEQASA